MIDGGICPWCQTVQAFTSYGRQQCQICSKPIIVTPDKNGGDVLQNHADYWNTILSELLAMEAELEVLGLEPRKMIEEVIRRIGRLAPQKPLVASQSCKADDRFVLYPPASNKPALIGTGPSWETRIRQALQKELFFLHAQPLLDLQCNEITRYELLLRMAGKEGEVILPTSFLGMAERYDLIHPIDLWVVSQAIHLIAKYRRRGRELCLEVNLSGKAFANKELLPLIQRELAATGIPPACLVLAMTETAAVADLNHARRLSEALKELGCQFALDNFGRGFASFHYLKHMLVDYLKITGDFIRNLPRDLVDQHLVKAMVEVARGRGIQTVAECVENEEIVQLLRELGVDYAQGYHVGRPLPVSQVLPH